jgi:guanylate kinase
VSPFPVILSAPSGGGKTTIAHKLLDQRSDLGYSVSCTTRPARDGEVDGRDYYFLTHEEFETARANGDFAESAEVHGNFYGTLRREVDRVMAGGRHVVMDIDVQGTRQFVEAFPESVLIFVIPPDAAAMLERLTGRGTESANSLARRLRSAVAELRAVDLYGYLVVNDDLGEAVQAVSRIIDAEEFRLGHVAGYRERVGALVADLQAELEKLNRSA